MARQTNRESGKIRVITIYRELLKKKKINTSEIINLLRCRYGITVDRKTIIADMQAIDRIVPIKTIPGRNGGYILWDAVSEAEEQCTGEKQ
jgi:predicted DNA-binding transcriptional regulator YafY